MHPAVRDRIERLLELLDVQAAGGALRVSTDLASVDDLESVGRSVTLVHTVASTGLLGALAHAAGFSYVRREGGRVLALQAAGPLAAIVSATTTADERTAIAFRVEPRARPAAIDATGATAVVANTGTDTVSRIDAVAGRILEAYKVGWGPVAVAVAAGAKLAFAADRRSGTLTTLELGGAVADRLDVGGVPVALARHPTKPLLLVALEGNELLEVDITGLPLSVASRTGLGDSPTAVAFAPNGNATWAALAGGSLLEVNSGATVPLPGPPVAVAATNTRAYVALPSLGQVAVVDAAPPHNVKLAQVGTAPVAVAASSSVVCVADAGEARVHVLTPAGSAQRTVAVGRAPVALALSGDRLCVAVRAPDGDEGSIDAVRVISVSSLETTAMVPLGTGIGERITWTLRQLAAAQARLATSAAAATTLTAVAAGPVLVRAHLLRPDLGGPRGTPPFTFEVRLKDALQADPSIVIRKDQYDLVMNALSAFHPVGVEVLTRAIREKVVEVRSGLLDVFPDYTFPQFRARGPHPGARRPKE
jgi:DNA-binding beta-propeller fold protein YncE